MVVRFPAGPRVRLKTVDPPKGNGLGKKNSFLVLLFVCFVSHGKIRISDRGMCISSQRLCLVWVATSCRLYSHQKMILCLRICLSFFARTEPVSVIGQTPRKRKQDFWSTEKSHFRSIKSLISSMSQKQSKLLHCASDLKN